MPPFETPVSRLYLHPEQGWVQDPQDAILRLDASVIERRVMDSRNVLYRPDQKGGWQAVTDESDLDGRSRGLIWETWETAVDGQPYFAFRGLRVVDAEIGGLLAGTTVRDEEGVILSEPLRAGRLFLLDEQGAVVFAGRVKQAGGSIAWGSPLPQEASNSVARLRELGVRVDKDRAEDREVLTAARAGNLAGVAGFEGRTAGFLALCAEVFEVYSVCLTSLSHLLRQGKTMAEREEAAATLREARALRDQAVIAREERDEDASELAWRAGQGRGHHDTPPLGPLLAARAVGRLAAAAGHVVTEGDRTVSIELEDAVLELGDEFSYRPVTDS
jgi:hypothetical protein